MHTKQDRKCTVIIVFDEKEKASGTVNIHTGDSKAHEKCTISESIEHLQHTPSSHAFFVDI